MNLTEKLTRDIEYRYQVKIAHIISNPTGDNKFLKLAGTIPVGGETIVEPLGARIKKSIKDGVKKSWDWTKNKAEKSWDWTKDKAEKSWDWTKDNGWDWTKGTAEKLYNFLYNRYNTRDAYNRRQELLGLFNKYNSSEGTEELRKYLPEIFKEVGEEDFYKHIKGGKPVNNQNWWNWLMQYDDGVPLPSNQGKNP